MTLISSNDHDRPCTCGAEMHRCKIWSVVLPTVERQGGADHDLVGERYRELVDAVRKEYPTCDTIVDCSTDLGVLESLSSSAGLFDKILVVQLTKDIRSYLFSSERTARRKSRKFSLLQEVRNWRSACDHTDRALHGYDVIRVGYEELVFFPDEIFRIIYQRLGVTEGGNGRPRLGDGLDRRHIVRGNRMRFDERKNDRIVYDLRWFFEGRQIMGGVLSYVERKRLRRYVYSNLSDVSPFGA